MHPSLAVQGSELRRARDVSSPPTGEFALLVDLGKTVCRVRVEGFGSSDGHEHLLAQGEGAPGLGELHGASRALESILATYRTLAVPGILRAVAVGAAGAETQPAATAEFADELARTFHCAVSVVNDGVAAHAGAFAGGPGALLVAGTGSILIDKDVEGLVTQADGSGPWVGDEGSGRWIGQRGLTAVLRAAEGRGPSTLLLLDAREQVGRPEAIPSWVAAGGDVARRLASFAPHVLARAAQGDRVADDIVEAACRHLVTTAGTTDRRSVCVVGGLLNDTHFAERLSSHIRAAGMTPVPARGDALDGARLIALGLSPIDASQVHRAKP